MKLIYSVATILAASLITPAQGRIGLAPYLTDSMVVQQQSTLKLKGRSASQVNIAASWLDRRESIRPSADSTFSATLPTPAAGGPFTITLTDSEGDTLTLSDIYSGEVWLCSGQSNMEMPVGGWGKVTNYEAEIDSARHYPLVRLLQVAHRPSPWPEEEAALNMGGWRRAQPATVENFSSIAYFFARNLQHALGGVPVGVIDCSYGGTVAEAWTGLDAVKTIDGLGPLDLLYTPAGNRDSIIADYGKIFGAWHAKVEAAAAEASKDFDLKSYNATLPTMPVPGMWESSALPAFDGIVWLQQRFDLPADMTGKDLTLCLGLIDDNDITYINGTEVGRTDGCSTVRLYTIPASALRQGENVLSVRVFDLAYSGGMLSVPEHLFITDGSGQIPLAGDWRYMVAADFADRPYAPYDPNTPTVLYNAMLHPLHDIAIKGVLWYQGCSNVGRAEQYARLFPTLIGDWRRMFGKPELPFYFVQLAGYLEPKAVQPDSQWAALRQAQTAALKLDNTAMVSAIDLGESADIHPKNKQEVARRLTAAVLNRSYGRSEIEYLAPVPAEIQAEGTTASIRFSGPVENAGDVAIKGFIVATADGWQEARATQTAPDTITLTAPAAIKAIKYNWADYPQGTLRATSLPILPFEWEE